MVAVNYEQTLSVTVNDDPQQTKLNFPYSMSGHWQESEPIVVDLKQGINILKFSRTNPPQYGIAVKSFTLKPLK